MGQQLESNARGHRFDFAWLVLITSVGSEEEFVDLVVNTSFESHDMV